MRMSLLSRVTIASVIGLSLISGAPLAQSRPKFFSDDPILREPDTQDASKTQSWTIGLIADLTLNVFAANSRARRFYEREGWSAEMMKYVKPLQASE